MQRTCKICDFVGPYTPEAPTAVLRGFHGFVCWACILAEQRAWRGTALGREEAREASAMSRARKRERRAASRDA